MGVDGGGTHVPKVSIVDRDLGAQAFDGRSISLRCGGVDEEGGERSFHDIRHVRRKHPSNVARARRGGKGSIPRVNTRMERKDVSRTLEKVSELEEKMRTNPEDVARQLRVQMQQRAEKQRLKRAALVTTMDSGFLRKVEVRETTYPTLDGPAGNWLTPSASCSSRLDSWLTPQMCSSTRIS